MEFVNFSIATKLKEKGFREECFANYYCSDKAYFERNTYNPDTESNFYCYNNDEDLGRFYIDAPTISQVLKWLRKEKKILITIIPQEKNLGHDTLCFAVYKITEDLYQLIYNGTVNTLVDSYEQLSIAGIEYVLDNLI